jgi:hypothetical protein
MQQGMPSVCTHQQPTHPRTYGQHGDLGNALLNAPQDIIVATAAEGSRARAHLTLPGLACKWSESGSEG